MHWMLLEYVVVVLSKALSIQYIPRCKISYSVPRKYPPRFGVKAVYALIPFLYGNALIQGHAPDVGII